MKKTLAVIFILMCVFLIAVPVDARIVLSYDNQSSSSGAQLTLYPYEKSEPEPQVRYVETKKLSSGYYDEDGYYKSDKRIKRKRGGRSKIIYNAFPLYRPNYVPNFGAVNSGAKPAPVYTHRPLGS